MKRSNLLVAVAVAGSMFGSLAAAQVTPGGQGNYRVPSPTQERRDDRWDLKRLQSLRDRLQYGIRSHDKRALWAVDADLRSYLASELREQRNEVTESQEDLRGGKALRSEARELRAERRDLTRLRQIDSELQKMYGRRNRRSLDRRAILTDELVKLEREQLREARRQTSLPYAWR